VRVLITGSQGYVGPVVAGHLRAEHPDWILKGIDTGYFLGDGMRHDTVSGILPEDEAHVDVRDLSDDHLSGMDAVVHLAAISNDPMGKEFESATFEINHLASVNLAERAKRVGASSFVFASSCSVYGIASGGVANEQSSVYPMTAYARSKVEAERDLQKLASTGFTVTCLRFATACGMSPRLRLDLVLNDFVASAVAARRIDILSDGSPWRPLIDVSDMARAIDWGIMRSRDNGGPGLVVNVGHNAWNYQVKDLARAVTERFPDIDVSINGAGGADKRSYRVDFSLFRDLAPYHQPKCSLPHTIANLQTGLEAMGFSDPSFRDSKWTRLWLLRRLLEESKLTQDLRWA
jgi:nucleoside-diphosphate-sugar epimerase